jgi:hypothetical protein
MSYHEQPSTEFMDGVAVNRLSGVEPGEHIRYGLGATGRGRNGEVIEVQSKGVLVRDLDDGRKYLVQGKSWIRRTGRAEGPTPAEPRRAAKPSAPPKRSSGGSSSADNSSGGKSDLARSIEDEVAGE